MFNEYWYADDQCIELVKLVNKIINLEKGNIIEIGCWEGRSTVCITNACYPENLICNDTWLGNVQESSVTGVTHITE